MPRINFLRLSRPSLEVEIGANLMKSLLAAGLPVASSCNGDGICGKCKIEVRAPALHTNSPNEVELILRDKFNLRAPTRISCQVAVLGDISVDAAYW